MAQDLPDALRLRHVKYGEKTSAAERKAVARRLLAAGRRAEALDLFLIAGDDEGIRECRAAAVAEGRPVLLLMLRRAGLPVGREEWRKAAAAAETAGRWRDAFRCYTEVEDEEGLARVREHLPDYELYTPQGK